VRLAGVVGSHIDTGVRWTFIARVFRRHRPTVRVLIRNGLSSDPGAGESSPELDLAHRQGTTLEYHQFFSAATFLNQPHGWQRDLAQEGVCRTRLIRVPTGFGKTLGVLTAWAFHRLQLDDDRWPRRLVWCLPMRVLVEQTENEVRDALSRLGVIWDGQSDHEGKVGVHVLMGGTDTGEWHLYPEHCAVLIGTQDMLLSRAMNRGYASPRARWPMEFGLLNQDCLWVMDEVQLMDVGLATSAQLQAFRRDDVKAGRGLRPCHTWWMSATLQQWWIEKSPDTHGMVRNLGACVSIPRDKRTGWLWDDVSKPCRREALKDEKALARLIVSQHVAAGRGARGPTLVVLNTVDRAVQIFDLLTSDKALRKELGGTDDIRLVHSRFRPSERRGWREEFLNPDACSAGIDRIIVATQVVEAGVDISAGLLVTEVAPWASLVQRFGRCARRGGTAQVIIADFGPPSDLAAAPYAKDELDSAREALTHLDDVAPRHLEAFEEQHGELLPRLYPYSPSHLLLRHELDELFDTTPDLSGADIDISRFIRSGEERDLSVFWADVPAKTAPRSDLRPRREVLCAVPFLKARDWLCGNETAGKKAPRLKDTMRAWVWDWLDGAWKRAERRDLYPGQTVLVAADCGGYDSVRGWSPDSTTPVPTLTIAAADLGERADAAQDDESLSAYPWQTIAVHGRATGDLACRIAQRLVPAWAALFDLAGRWHDAGKVHPVFNNSIVDAKSGEQRPKRRDLAKAPQDAWLPMRKLYPMGAPSNERRPGFRHELASTLALFGVLQRHAPDHAALLGPWRELLLQSGMTPEPSTTSEPPPTPLEREILDLDAASFDLLAYLVCAHHGKVRLAWHACPADQEATSGALRIRGIEPGDRLPALVLASRGGFDTLPETVLDLAPAAAGLSPRTGAGWTERALKLLSRHGPFALAWLEALLRAADQRASRRTDIVDPLLESDNGSHDLDGIDTAQANAATAGAAAPPSGSHPAPRRDIDGDGGRADRRGSDPGTTPPPAAATRYADTEPGVVSHAQLAPHLAARAAHTELSIALRETASAPLDEYLLLDLHRRTCGDLVPAIAGRWRTRDVQAGTHTPPVFFRVPATTHEYAAGLAARIAHLPETPGERLIETLALAEGELLHIHPFEDFNGPLARLFLLELLYRLDLPIVNPAPEAGADTQRYLAALRGYDQRDVRPLAEFWRNRFEKESSA
jgi:CRISPR-associated endonuclease/helicase Cas3